MANSRDEQQRNSRRLARQLIGAAALVLIVIGVLTVFNWLVAGVRTALDDSDRRARYADRVYGLVMFDVVPFSDASQVDPSVFRQAAIWGTVYRAQQEGTIDSYERDPETGSLILPQLEIDTYLTNLLGPDYPLAEGSFETAEFIYTYNEEKQGYLVPVTGAVGLYTPEVERIWREGGQTHVTVGYIPTLSNTASGELSLTAPTEPTKYMDFVFSRGENRQWYLTALQESATQPQAQATATPAPTAGVDDPQAMVQDNLDSTMTDAVNDPAAAGEGGEEPAPEETEPAPEEDGGEPAEDGGEDAGENTDESTDENTEDNTEENTEEPAEE